MTKFSREQVELVAKAMKVIRLANNTMLDEIAIKLNCSPNYDEMEYAQRWALAFELCQEECNNAWDLALRLHKGT